ncbi:MAG: sigma-70 family RNA polymerase sigma factor [Acidobacteriaceae bacterium]|nr:sigma-70 family RNA polymerase sigma factor [Acidobacteriaceae bacterium]MBV9781246.1 sigma-70 family RNA polymerase sigma factor [Acidobacteriaceae bacterium]
MGPKDAEVDRLVCLAYNELRRLAASFLNQERPGHTLQPTALVHEAYLRLRRERKAEWQSKTQFLAIAAQSMRRILVDHGRSRVRLKRGGPQQKISLEDVSMFSNEQFTGLVALDRSLARLSTIDPRQGQIVELRIFGGLSIEEAAEVLAISPKTVKRDWIVAKAWLYRDLRGQYGSEAAGMGTGQEPV